MGKKRDAFSIMKSGSVHEQNAKERKRKLSCGASSEQACKKTKSDESSVAKFFQMSWLEEFKWLKSENRTMFCSLCILHKSKSKFSQSGSTNFRVSSLREHEGSSGHLNSLKLDSDIQSRQIPSVSECINKESDKIEAAVCRLIRTAYTVAKSHMPISMYAELCELQLCNDTCLTKNLYQEDSACTEFITLISQSLDDSLIEKLRQSPALGLMIDESTDLGMEKHLIVFINYLDKGILQTSYLTLIKLTAADANVVFSSLVGYLRACDIDIRKVYGFSSDGAAVMVGKQNGVAQRLKNENEYMLSMHCVAHKLALSSLDAAKSIKEVSYFEGMLHSIHSFFNRSSKRLEHLRLWQDILDDPKVKPLSFNELHN